MGTLVVFVIIVGAVGLLALRHGYDSRFESPSSEYGATSGLGRKDWITLRHAGTY